MMPLSDYLSRSKRPGRDPSVLAIRAAAITLYVAARGWRLTASCLWFDELFSLHAARHDLSSLFAFAVEDLVHPPLFYLLLKSWVALGGDGLLWVRLLPVILSCAALVPFLLLCRELQIRPAAVNVALLLWATSDYAIKYAQEVRMYSLLLLLGLSSYWLCLRFLRAPAAATARRQEACALFAVNLLLVYTHYYGWAVVAVELGYILLRARRQARMFAIQVGLLVLAFAPWALLVARAAARQQHALGQNIGWAARPDLRAVGQFYLSLHELPLFRWNLGLSLLLFLAPLAALLWRHFRHEEPHEQEGSLAWLLLGAFAPAGLALAASYALPHSVWGVRHLINAAPFYYLLIGLALASLRPPLLRSVALALFACWLLLATSILLFRRPENYVWCAWEPFTERMRREETGGGSISVLTFEDLIAYHVWSALDAAGDRRFRVIKLKGLAGVREDPAYFLPRLFDGVEVRGPEAFDGERFWLLFRDASWDEGREPLRTLRARGYEIEEKFETDTSSGKAFLVAARRRGAP